jgi:hypothetical protein
MDFLRRLIVAPLFALALVAASGAPAQTTAPAAPTVTPAPNCEKPGDAPSTNAPEMSKAVAEQKYSSWTKSMKAYLECLKRFVDEHQAAAAPHLKAANAAVDEYNKAIKIYNDRIDAQRPQ